MKHYLDPKDLGLDKLKPLILDANSHVLSGSPLVIACHDAFIEYNGGILLVKGNAPTYKGCFGPVSSEIKKGLHIETSLRKTIKDDVNLEVEHINSLGVSRMFFEEEPFGSGNISDTIRFAYFGKGSGDLRLNNKSYSTYTIIQPKNYNDSLRLSLHPYVKDLMEFAIRLVKG